MKIRTAFLALLLILSGCRATVAAATPATQPPGMAATRAFTPFTPLTRTPRPILPATPSPTIRITPTATLQRVFTLIGAGDITYCANPEGAEIVARLLDALRPDAIFTAGDNSNDEGTSEQFHACFDPSWGRHKALIHPAPGNHDYLEPGAAGYYAYFGAAAGVPGEGYYSYDLGAWHIIALNSVCWEVGGCGAGSPQLAWLQADLAAHPGGCTLAYWHHPLYSSGKHGANPMVQSLWQALLDAGAEIVVNGHDHHYERFAPQDANGNLDRGGGIRQYIVGTGGAGWRIPPAGRAANSEALLSGVYGVLHLTLYPGGYAWQFIPEPGSPVIDFGSGACH